MGRGKHLMQKLADAADLAAEPIPGNPVVELAGDRRVIVEGHRGVECYSRELICIRVSYGTVSVQGRGLEFARMNQEQLVICGCIDKIELQRRKP